MAEHEQKPSMTAETAEQQPASASSSAAKTSRPLRSPAFYMLFGILTGALLCLIILVALEVLAYPAMPEPYAPPPTPPPPSEQALENSRLVPARVYFEAQRESCQLVALGLTEDGAIQTSDTTNKAAWYKYGASPGDPGNAILSGHDRWRGMTGAFDVVKQLQIGDQVTIEFTDGSFRFFTVISNNTYGLDSFPLDITQIEGPSRLTLITCYGDYESTIETSLSRVVVVCEELRRQRLTGYTRLPAE